MKDEIRRILSRHKKSQITRREIAEAAGVPAEEKGAFRKAIDELLEEGVLIRVKKSCYAIQSQAGVVTGKIQAHRSGFGFLIPDPESGLGGDVYIGAANLGDATHGDRVVVELLGHRPGAAPRSGRPGAAARTGKPAAAAQKREGRVVRVLERGARKIIGKILFLKKPVVFPLDARYHYTVNVTNAADFPVRDNDVVAVELTTDPSANTRPSGRILALVGSPGDPDLPLKIALAKHDIPTEFPAEVLSEARAAGGSASAGAQPASFAAGAAAPIPPGPSWMPSDLAPSPPGGAAFGPDLRIPAAEPPIPAAELNGREDFRHLPAVTIDGETAFDFDDAVNAAKNPDGSYTLWVHIADVSRYVRPQGALDAEAFRRGTSVYFPDRAVPMLPPELSSHACSLLPGRDRLCFTAVLTIDGRNGSTRSARFTPSVIRSRARMTYPQVTRILEGDAELRGQFAPLLAEFETMAGLFALLNRRRRDRGAIDFDLPEQEIRYDASDTVIGIYKAERTLAHRIIEEFMLAANEAVAAFFMERGLPSLYRIHEPPDPLKVQEFAEIAGRFGHTFEADKEEFSPRDFQQIADTFDSSAVGKYLSYVMLRSFKLAVYSEKNSGHFGLAARDYTHFTSPIRRYPDLVVHRLLRWALAGEPFQDGQPRLLTTLPEIARQSSGREQEAVAAEREVLAWKRAEFMQAHLGEEFAGFVSGIRPNGFSVELSVFFVEGFVNLSSLEDDYYLFDEPVHAFMGERTGRTFRLGTPVTVRVDRVDMERYLLDFSVVSGAEEAAGERPGARPKRRPKDGTAREKSSRRPKGRVVEEMSRRWARDVAAKEKSSQRPKGRPAAENSARRTKGETAGRATPKPGRNGRKVDRTAPAGGPTKKPKRGDRPAASGTPAGAHPGKKGSRPATGGAGPKSGQLKKRERKNSDRPGSKKQKPSRN